MKTNQTEFWTGDFGKEYTERNSHSLEDWNEFYRKNWGYTKIEMNELSLQNIRKDSRILEVGCNTGMQLRGLQKMGFKNLYGIEIQKYAIEKAKEFTKGINIIEGNGLDIPFKDNFFDLVFTNGVLIHISPTYLHTIMGEMYRCTSKYIWGWEYYAPTTQEINYRGNKGVLWKADYAALFLKKFPNLKLISYQDYPYITDSEKGNVDRMYLLSK